MRARQAISLCIFTCLLSAGGRASADDAMTDTARELFVKGARAAEQQRWDQCRAAMLAALAIKQHPQVAGNLAGCELKLKLYRDAAEHLAYFLRELKPDAPREKRANAEAALREAQAKLDTIRLQVSTEGAEVRVDGKSVGRTPLRDPIFLEPGTHTIEVAAERASPVSATIESKAGMTRDLWLTLKKEEPVPPPPPPPPPKRSAVPGVVLGSVAGAALATGIGLMVKRGADRSAARDLSGAISGAHHSCVAGAGNYDARCAALNDTALRAARFHDAGVGVLIGAGAAAAGSVVYFLWPSPSPKTAGALRVSPEVSATGWGATFSGTF